MANIAFEIYLKPQILVYCVSDSKNLLQVRVTNKAISVSFHKQH